MLAVALGALAVALAALGLVGAAFHVAVRRADTAGQARADAATAAGEVLAANERVGRANDAVASSERDAERQRIRANALEGDLAHAETYPIAPGDPARPDHPDRVGRAQLRAALQAAAGVRPVPSARAAGGDQGDGLPAEPTPSGRTPAGGDDVRG